MGSYLFLTVIAMSWNSRACTLVSCSQPVSVPSATFMCVELDGVAFGGVLDECYKEVVHWKRNIVLVPTGGVGKAFLDEVARLWSAKCSKIRTIDRR